MLFRSDAHEGLEYGVAAHGLHHAQRANAAGDEKHDDAGDDRERKQDQAGGLVFNERRDAVQGDQANGAASHHVLTVMTVHPGAVRPGFACGKDGHASCEEHGAEGGGNEGDDDILLCHGIQPFKKQASVDELYLGILSLNSNARQRSCSTFSPCAQHRTARSARLRKRVRRQRPSTQKLAKPIKAVLSSTDVRIPWPGLFGHFLSKDGTVIDGPYYDLQILSNPGT